MYEPRGHDGMYGCIITPPSTPNADIGVLFMHNEGRSTMCGHGVICSDNGYRNWNGRGKGKKSKIYYILSVWTCHKDMLIVMEIKLNLFLLKMFHLLYIKTNTINY